MKEVPSPCRLYHYVLCEMPGMGIIMRPNIIIVMTDQQRADLRKAAGYSLDTMPFLDNWAKAGVDFSCAYTANPTCMPARVSMFTGRYPESHKVRTNHNRVDALYTEDLLDILKKQGYSTAMCGKNHSHRTSSDFDFWEETGHLGHEGNLENNEEEEVFANFLDATLHMEAHVPAPGGVEVQHPYRNVSSAFKFLDQHDKEKPFFMWLSFAEPHNPYQVPEPYFDMFRPENLPELQTSVRNLPDKGHRFTWIREVWEKVLGENIEDRILRARSNYHGMLRLIDDQFKRLVEGLNTRGLSNNTIVIFLSDHGDFAGEYGLIRKGTDLPEVLTRIPMIWNGPGISAQGRRDNVFVNIVDILPTICDLLEIDCPFGVQGKSILSLLDNKDIPEGEFDTAYAESGFSGLYWTGKDDIDLIAEGASQDMKTFDCLNTWTQCGQVRMLRKGHLKIQVDMLGKGYLYNLKEDPFEINNLWDAPEYVEMKTQMLTELIAATLKACDPLPVPHHRYRTKIHPKGYWKQDYFCEDTGVRNLPPLSELAKA